MNPLHIDMAKTTDRALTGVSFVAACRRSGLAS
jgi:hypothetical protein